jgi:hypothetical protein
MRHYQKIRNPLLPDFLLFQVLSDRENSPSIGEALSLQSEQEDRQTTKLPTSKATQTPLPEEVRGRVANGKPRTLAFTTVPHTGAESEKNK